MTSPWMITRSVPYETPFSVYQKIACLFFRLTCPSPFTFEFKDMQNIENISRIYREFIKIYRGFKKNSFYFGTGDEAHPTPHASPMKGALFGDVMNCVDLASLFNHFLRSRTWASLRSEKDRQNIDIYRGIWDHREALSRTYVYIYIYIVYIYIYHTILTNKILGNKRWILFLYSFQSWYCFIFSLILPPDHRSTLDVLSSHKKESGKVVWCYHS